MLPSCRRRAEEQTCPERRQRTFLSHQSARASPVARGLSFKPTFPPLLSPGNTAVAERRVFSFPRARWPARGAPARALWTAGKDASRRPLGERPLQKPRVGLRAAVSSGPATCPSAAVIVVVGSRAASAASSTGAPALLPIGGQLALVRRARSSRLLVVGSRGSAAAVRRRRGGRGPVDFGRRRPQQGAQHSGAWRLAPVPLRVRANPGLAGSRSARAGGLLQERRACARAPGPRLRSQGARHLLGAGGGPPAEDSESTVGELLLPGEVRFHKTPCAITGLSHGALVPLSRCCLLA